MALGLWTMGPNDLPAQLSTRQPCTKVVPSAYDPWDWGEALRNFYPPFYACSSIFKGPLLKFQPNGTIHFE